jgi:hypothetical protein
MVEVVIQEVEVHLQIHLVLDQQVMELSTLVVVVEEQLLLTLVVTVDQVLLQLNN